MPTPETSVYENRYATHIETQRAEKGGTAIGNRAVVRGADHENPYGV